VIYSQLVVVATSATTFSYWWYVVVPARRTELAKDKRDKADGKLGNYLDELKAEVNPVPGSSEVSQSGEIAKTRGRRFERWLLADWLSDSSDRKAAALPFLPRVSRYTLHKTEIVTIQVNHFCFRQSSIVVTTLF
jgi:hypothetical protein